MARNNVPYLPGRSSRLSSPAATLRPTWPCTLSGCSAIELSEPPTSTLPPSADADRRAALRAGVVAGEIARPEPRDRREDAPGQRQFLGDAEIDADLADGRDIAVLRHAVDAQHATEIGHGADDEADARAAAAFENADLNALHRAAHWRPAKDATSMATAIPARMSGTTHEEISG